MTWNGYLLLDKPMVNVAKLELDTEGHPKNTNGSIRKFKTFQ